MRTLRIPKRNGTFRTVVCPDAEHKEDLRGWLPELHAAAMVLDVHGVQHGFVLGRSPVTNARCHIGYQWTVSFDLADCFDHVTRDTVHAAWGFAPDRFFVDGIARQGLPTSPILANIALAPADSDIVSHLKPGEVYTRYADDLTISTNDEQRISFLLIWVPYLVKQRGFLVNKEKTLVQSAKAGRRHVTGVAVDDTGVYPTRSAKRRLRAALHRNRISHARGLAEWCKLKPPRFENAFSKLAGNKFMATETKMIASVLVSRADPG